MDNLPAKAERLVHLDLKGAPPKLGYFEKLLPFVKNLGATGVLLEWEDTFPYTKELLRIGGLSDSAQVSGAPYTFEEAQQLLNLAVDSDLTVIPLIQTFGHMEYVLKHDEWKHLREVELYPNSICPTNCETLALIRRMIKQIVAFHTGIKFIHIGGDEVWHMGACPACSERCKENKYGKHGLYIEHIIEIVQFIKDNYPFLKVLIWDDMLRDIDVKVLQEYYIGNYIEPVIWHYNSIETFNLNINNLLEKYNSIFNYLWIGTAFKGATTSCQILPINKYHVSNHQAWLNILNLYGSKFRNFRGLILTGWSRYDHYATLCELLPSGVPSLCLCLKTWLTGNYNEEIHNSIGRMLGYNETTTNFGSPIKTLQLPQLTFPGWQIFIGFEWYLSVKTKYRNIVDSDQVNSWLNQWQVLNNYTNPIQVHTILPVVSDCLNELIMVETYLKPHLEQVFYLHTIDELIGTLITPLKQNLNHLKDDCETQLSLGCRVRGQRRINL